MTTRKKTGRRGGARSAQLNIRLTPPEKAALMRLADERNLTVTALLVLELCLGAPSGGQP